MSTNAINVRIPPDLKDQIDQARGDIPRERWIRRALEATLSEPKEGMDTTRSGPSSVPFAATEGGRPAASLRAHPQSCRCGVCLALKAKS